jgi:hypothetical protein
MTHLLTEEQINQILNTCFDNTCHACSKLVADAEHQAHVDAGWKSPEDQLDQLKVIAELNRQHKLAVEQAKRETREEVFREIEEALFPVMHPMDLRWQQFQALKSGQRGNDEV